MYRNRKCTMSHQRPGTIHGQTALGVDAGCTAEVFLARYWKINLLSSTNEPENYVERKIWVPENDFEQAF